MKNLIFSLIVFIIIYLLYVIFVINKKKKLENFKNSMYINYLVNISKIDLKQVNIKKLAHVIALANAFILSSTVFIIDYINNFFLKLLVGFIILIPLLFITYFIIGKFYKNKELNRKKR